MFWLQLCAQFTRGVKRESAENDQSSFRYRLGNFRNVLDGGQSRGRIAICQVTKIRCRGAHVIVASIGQAIHRGAKLPALPSLIRQYRLFPAVFRLVGGLGIRTWRPTKCFVSVHFGDSALNCPATVVGNLRHAGEDAIKCTVTCYRNTDLREETDIGVSEHEDKILSFSNTYDFCFFF
jgi:hypothetical protein